MQLLANQHSAHNCKLLSLLMQIRLKSVNELQLKLLYTYIVGPSIGIFILTTEEMTNNSFYSIEYFPPKTSAVIRQLRNTFYGRKSDRGVEYSNFDLYLI